MEPLDPDDPRWIGPYQVLARIGSGGMGQVLLGASPGARQVAIKLIHADVAQDESFRARFRREVAAARAVSGAFTAPVVDADVEAATPWLVTAYLPGMSLQDAVRELGPLPLASVRALAIGLVEALIAIHRAGVVHRDLKPSNVILTPEGPRVIDFGIARSADASTLTRTGAVVGTPTYMSPEQAGHGQVGPAADVFSLGGVLVFAATGSGPFTGRAVHEVLHRVVHEPPNLEGITDPWLRGLIAGCLEKDPARRPDLASLLRWLAPEDSTVLPHGTAWLPSEVAAALAVPPTVPPAPGPPRRRLVLFGSVAAVAVAVGGAATAARLLGGGGQTQPDPFLWTRSWQGTDSGLGPTIVGGTVYVASNLNPYAVDARTGQLRWRAQVSLPRRDTAEEQVPIAVVGGVGYVHEQAQGGPARLVAIDLRTGAVLWRRQGNATEALISISARPPAIAGGVACLPDMEKAPTSALTSRELDGLRAFDVRTGRPGWWYGADEPISTGVTAAGGIFYAGGREGNVHAVDATTGRRRWRAELSGQPAAPPLVAGGLVLVTTSVNTVHAFDASTGEARWEARTSGSARLGSPAPVVAGGMVYFGSPDGTLHAFDAASGTGRWTFNVGGDQNHYLPPVPYRDLVFIYNRTGTLYALDAATGRGRWRQPVEAALVSRPTVERPVVAGGRLHIGGDALYSFDPSTGRRIRKLETKDDGPLGVVLKVVAQGDVLYVLHYRASQSFRNVSAVRP